MAAFTGILLADSILTVLDNTVFEDVIAIDISPYTAWVGDLGVSGTKVNVLPVAAISGHTGWLAPDYADLWYNHFHIIPNRINLGNLTSQQVRAIEFFNGYFSNVTVNAVTATGLSGVSLNLMATQVFAPLQSLYRDLTVGTIGALTFDGYFEIDTDDIKGVYFLYVTGQRVLVLPFQHNWTDNISERLAWYNTSSKALDGTEQLVVHRKNPRRSLDYSLLLASSQTNAARVQALFKAVMFNWQDKVFVVPVWTDATRLQTDADTGDLTIAVPTTYFDYDIGSYIMLWQNEETYEVVEIESMTSGSVTVTAPLLNDWPAKGTVVMPARQAYVSPNLSGIKHTVDINSVPVTCEFLAQFPSLNRLVAASQLVYRTYPVLMTDNNYVGSHSFNIEREVVRNDSNVGIFRQEGVHPIPDGSNSFAFMFANHQQAANFYSWLDSRKGRAGIFWQPTWSHDMEVLADIGAADTGFLINSIGYSNLLYVDGVPAHSRRDVMIRLKNGTLFFRRITGVTLNTVTNEESVGIDTALGQVVDADDIDRVSFLIPSALKADAVELSWASGDVSQSQIMIADVYSGNI